MKIQTTIGVPMNAEVLYRYLCSLINLFFKILPLKESGEHSLETYMRSLQAELLGCNALVETVHDDPMFLSLVSILQYLIDTPDCDVAFVRREVFRAISICEKLKECYSIPGEARP